MDEHRFDQLSRRLAGFRTRRQAVKAIAGAVVATVAGVKYAEAQTCIAHYSPCSGDIECCSGSVCEYGLCMPGCRIDGAFYSAWISPPDNICGQCLPDVSTTAWTPANEGMSCWSGDPNAGVTTCQAGTCAAVTASCPPPTACHLEGEVDPATGMCANPPAPEGTPCGNGSMCHGGFYQPADMCDDSGFCIGGGSRTVSCAPYQCGEDACLTTCASDDDCVIGTSCINGVCKGNVCAEPDSDGVACDVGNVCLDGSCTGSGICTVSGAGGCGSSTCGNGLTGCVPTVEGGLTCTGGVDCGNVQSCTSSDECPDGQACFAGNAITSCSNICRDVCSAAIASFGVSSAAEPANGGIDTP